MWSFMYKQLCTTRTVLKRKSVSDSDGLVDAGLMIGFAR